ncbi:MAG: excinuclease ABC subunit UvrC [Clostridia bacterium]|nr:excinuclease ABC subunit UvrC [Clostridia bacterium]
MNERLEELRKKASELPLQPGVYLMRNKNGKIIYVGKSRALRNRVSQYFSRTDKLNIKTAHMVDRVYDFDIMLTDSEIEALSLENKLIKLHQPRFNIKLKDGKTYPYIKVTASEEYPRLLFTRKRMNDGSKYFGPYSSSSAAYDIIKTASRCFAVPKCKKVFPRDIGKERPCIYHQLGQCMAPCTGKVSPEEYNAVISDMLKFLGGSFGQVKSAMTERMMRYSDNMMYEAAAAERDRIAALDRLRQTQNILGAPGEEYDIFGFYQNDVCSCLNVLYVRDGCLIDKASFIFSAGEIVDPDTLTSFIADHYRTREYIPALICFSYDIGEENRSLLEAHLSEKAGRKIEFRIPVRGRMRELCALSDENAELRSKQYQSESEKDSETLIRLARLLSLEVVPQRIEAYDISNFGSDNITGGMITVIDCKFSKSDYRSFKIKSISAPDDYSAMRETITRRLAHRELEYPDLILLDGGKGHVSVIRSALADAGADIPVYGMVKDDYHKTRALVSDTEEISIAKEQSVFSLIFRIQEEIHRYTITRMKSAKGKSVRRSSLCNINGIGDSKAKLLLSALGSYRSVTTATVEELARIKGITRRNAEDIFDYFHRKERSEK